MTDVPGQLSFLGNPDAETIGKFQREGAAVTQRLAAVQARPQTAKQRRMVLNELLARGEDGATDEEIQITLALNPSSQRPRRVELVEQGWVEDSERRRRTRSGRSAVVWVVTEAGRAA